MVYPLPHEQTVYELTLERGATVTDALRECGLFDKTFDDKSLNVIEHQTPIGIYGERVSYDDILEEGDRVEVYRALVIDPMEARRARAQQQKSTSKKR